LLAELNEIWSKELEKDASATGAEVPGEANVAEEAKNESEAAQRESLATEDRAAIVQQIRSNRLQRLTQSNNPEPGQDSQNNQNFENA